MQHAACSMQIDLACQHKGKNVDIFLAGRWTGHYKYIFLKVVNSDLETARPFRRNSTVIGGIRNLKKFNDKFCNECHIYYEV